MQQKSLAVPTQFLDNTPLVILALLFFDSLHFVFARLLLPYFPPTVSSFYVLGIATIQVAIFMKMKGMIDFSPLRQHLWFFGGIGFLVAVSTILTFASVAFIDPGTASLLGKSSIIFGVGLGIIWLKEKLMRRQVVGGIIAITGVIIISFQPGDYFRLGSAIVIVATLMYALHTALYKRYGTGIGLADFFLFRLAGTTTFLFLVVLFRREFLLPSSGQAWAILLLVATVDVVLSRTLYYLALKRINLSLHSIILTLSPVAAILWTLLLFEVGPTAPQIIGGVAVMAGVFITVNQPQKEIA